jgi:tetratricopeptide (TPR) repeat protein
VGLLLYKLKRPEEGEAYLAKAMQGGGLMSKSDYVNLGRSLYYLHFYKESAMYYGEGLKLQATGGDYYNQACSYALAGEKEKAFESLEQAAAHGFNKKHQFENDTDLASLKADAKWNILLEKLK